jgi:signal transduction histidine kinase
VAFLNRLLGSPDGWAGVESLLTELCAAFGARAAGFRWPAEGPAIVSAEVGPLAREAIHLPVKVPHQPAGELRLDGARTDDGFAQLLASVLGTSPALSKFLAPVTDQARIAQRLEDAAKVAGRVAHDLDNVFQGVSGFLALALEGIAPGSPAHNNVREADTAARAGMRFCVQLHQLSRGGNARPLPAAVSAALNRELPRLAAEHANVKFAIEVPADLPAVAIEGSGLQLMLGLLLDNAAEAGPKDGTVSVTARLVELAADELPGFLGRPAAGPHVEVRISDQGPGLTDEARRKMFVEPFFTTKYRHRGLSLAVVYRMLYAHRGGVQSDARPSQGTVVRVVFPLAAARVPAVETGRASGGYVS